MGPNVIEGTWEEIARRAAEFAGRRVRVTVLDEFVTPAKPASQEGLFEEAFKQQLLAMGLVSQLPTGPDGKADDSPITIQGEPVSETILRERR